MINCEDARSIKQCIEMATCDANGEDEQTSGWLVCFEEVFEDVDDVEVLGEIVSLVGFESVGTAVVAVCSKGKKKARVTIDSVSVLGATRAHKLWLRAWKSWQNL